MSKVKTKKKLSYSTYYLLLSAFLFLAAFLERTVWNLGPNIELVTTAMILAGFYLGRKGSFWLTFAIVALSDRIIGNSNIFLFTWSGFLIPALLFSKLFANSKLTAGSENHLVRGKIKNYRWKLVGLTGAGLFANLFFYIWTNFGVWLLDSWGMYTKDLPGLIECYIFALPFLKNQIISSFIFIPAGYFVIEVAIRLAKKTKFNFLPQINKIPLK